MEREDTPPAHICTRQLKNQESSGVRWLVVFGVFFHHGLCRLAASTITFTQETSPPAEWPTRLHLAVFLTAAVSNLLNTYFGFQTHKLRRRPATGLIYMRPGVSRQCILRLWAKLLVDRYVVRMLLCMKTKNHLVELLPMSRC